MSAAAKHYCTVPLLANIRLSAEVFRLDFAWPGGTAAPRAGQFFMLKPLRSGSFLARPISVYRWDDTCVSFLVLQKGRGTLELGQLREGEVLALTGPLGNCWADFFTLGPVATAPATAHKPVALIGGGIGIAPLIALGDELSAGETPAPQTFDLYAGFRSAPFGLDKLPAKTGKLVIASEDGSEGRKGRIPDFVDYQNYAVVFACGPTPMLKAVAEKSNAAGVPCYISMEARMACGAGACLGCTITTTTGNRRCCADGPIFPAEEVIFAETAIRLDGPIFPAEEVLF
ncbi:MAG: dihydroorotate dehydrogenase electron transfer subunit [Treponema sp.]|jgi:NAD(P)H-flavin reductase|nr:dihydroorotate dehydrogenase electron transfer subunit [Treponema sp.]